MSTIVPLERIERKIFLIRGQKVMLDSHLAKLYGVPTKVFNQAVQRNIDRFPADFMFQLTDIEAEFLRSQFVTSNPRRGGRRYNPFVFTEHGVAMLSSILKSSTAIQVNITIMRTFAKLREILSSHKDLADKLKELETKCDSNFKIVFDAIYDLMNPPLPPKRKIGFMAEEEPAIQKSSANSR